MVAVLSTSVVHAAEQETLSPELLDFFSRVTWGTEDVLYQIPDWKTLLKDLPLARYLTLQRNGAPIAARMVLEKRFETAAGSLPAFYHSLFSVADEEKGNGYGRHLAAFTVRRLREQLPDGGLVYAFIEAQNRRSEMISRKMGYQKFGEFYAMSFSRLSPRPLATLALLAGSERERMVQKLSYLYAGHALADFRFSLRPAHYWTLRAGNEIICGVQVKPQCWQIRALAGTSGKLALKVFPAIPVLRDLFNPRSFKFLKLGNLYVKEGYEKLFSEFIEGILSVHQLKTAMIFMDKSSPVYQRIARVTHFGLLNALTQTKVNVFGFFHQMSDAQIQSLARPLVISPLDI